MPPIIINGVATSYDLPQYVGELFQKRTRPNTAVRLVGGINNPRLVGSTHFALGVSYELPEGSQPDIIEGADPVPSEIGVAQTSNVVQIFHEAVALTYSAMGNNQAVQGVVTLNATAPVTNPNSLEWQVDRKLDKMQRDVNYTFLNGAFRMPVNNAAGRRTRGLITAVTTHRYGNTAAPGTARPVSKDLIEDVLMRMSDAGAFNGGNTVYVMGRASLIAKTSKLYRDETAPPPDRNVAGIVPLVIVTIFGTINLIIEPDMPLGKLLFWQPGVCRPVIMPIPGKGLIFVEPLARTGSSEKYQLYGEVGVDYNSEDLHGLLEDLEP
jgi:hypothetical protein